MSKRDELLTDRQTELYDATFLDSCDTCAAQEISRHYCLLHSVQIKNMDTLRCDDWLPREREKTR